MHPEEAAPQDAAFSLAGTQSIPPASSRAASWTWTSLQRAGGHSSSIRHSWV